MVSLRVTLRRCPDCGAHLLGCPGLKWLTCVHCPLAIDPFSTPVRKATCWRPREDTGVEDDDPRLPFYLFRLVSSAVVPQQKSSGGLADEEGYVPARLRRRSPAVGSPSAVLPTLAWVNAFRIPGLQVHGDAGAKLTEKRYDPEIVAAPLSTAVVRGPGEAAALLRARLGLGSADLIDLRSIALVSLRCRIEGHLLREPVSNLVYPRSLVIPAVP